MNGIANHLWQSTVFAALVAVAAWLLRKNQARMRYVLWMAASLKFAVPFSWLMELGSHVEAPPVARGWRATAVEQVTSSFAPAPLMEGTVTAAPSFDWRWVLAGLWAAGVVMVMARWARQWWRVRQMVQSAAVVSTEGALPVLEAETAIEPGVFGIWKPVLLLPRGIRERLTAEELDSVLVHEQAHAERRDNLTAVMHMAVQAAFWFHPLVWWIGTKLVEERERACDEAVLSYGRERHVYAQSILNVCKFYVATPLPCTAGVSGADLRQRIEEILTRSQPLRLTAARAGLLAVAAIAVVTTPLVIGVLRAQTLPPPPQYKFDVASIRPGEPDARQVRIMPGPQGGLRTENTSLASLIGFAYDIRPFQLVGAPAWTQKETFNITATPDQAEEGPNPTMPREKMESMFNRQRQRMQALLTERFGLVLKAETREMPIYGLTVLKSGHKMKATEDQVRGPMGMRVGPGKLTGSGASMKMLVNALSQLSGRTVVDETGLPGAFDYELTYTPDNRSPGDSGGENGPSLFAALQEQLGLKLEPKKGPVPVFVVEKVNRPTEN